MRRYGWPPVVGFRVGARVQHYTLKCTGTIVGYNGVRWIVKWDETCIESKYGRCEQAAYTLQLVS